MKRFEEKVVIVTGAAKGIGRAIVNKFALEKAVIVAIDIDDQALNNLADDIGKVSEVIPYVLDVADLTRVKECVKEIREKYNQIHILVNNAGVRTMKSVFDYTIEDWEWSYQVNLLSMVNLCNEVLPNMIDHRYGKIINLGSIVSKTGETTSIPYCAIKGAVTSYTKALARVAAPYQININAIAPHAIDSDFIGYWDNDKREKIASAIPLKRLGTPNEIADVVLFLASEESSFIVGQTINVNGGYLME